MRFIICIFKLFEQISLEKKGKVTVFFCGNRSFGKTVRDEAWKRKFEFLKEYFN